MTQPRVDLLRQISRTPGDDVGVLSHRPELAARYRDFVRSIWAQPQPSRRVLELVRRRIAYIHDVPAERQAEDYTEALSAEEEAALAAGDFALFDAAEQLALQVAEQIPFAHHQLSDAQVSACQEAFGSPGAVNLLIACSFFDVNCRLKKSLSVAHL